MTCLTNHGVVMKKLLFVFIALITSANLLSGFEAKFTNYCNADWVYDAYEEGDEIWVLTNNCIVRYNKSTKEHKVFTATEGFVQSNYNYADIYRDKDGLITVGSYQSTYKFDGSEWINFAAEPLHISDDMIVNYYSIIGFDSQDRKWVKFYFNSQNYYARISDDNTELFECTQSFPLLKSINTSFIDNEDNLWIAGYSDLNNDEGCQIYQVKNSTISNWSGEDGLPKPYFLSNSFIVDKNGNIWFTNPNGTSKFANDTWTLFPYNATGDELKIQPNFTYVSDNGTIWFISNNRICSYNGSDWVYHDDVANQLGNIGINSYILIDNNNMWLGTSSGIFRKKDGNWNFYSKGNGLASNIVFDLIPVSNDVVLATSPKGISRFENDEWTVFNFSQLSAWCVTKVFQDISGKTWLLYNKNINYEAFLGIDIYDGTNFTPIEITNIGLFDNPSDIVQDKNGTIWLGGGKGGIASYNGQIWNHFGFSDHFDTEKDYYDISSMAIDSLGNIWAVAHLLNFSQEINGVPVYGRSNAIYKYDGSDWITVRHDKESDVKMSYSLEKVFVSPDNEILFTDNYYIYKLSGSELIKTDFNSDDNHDISPTFISFDKYGNMWITCGSRMGGIGNVGLLCKYDGLKYEFIDLTCSIAENLFYDKNNDYIWISTDRGLKRFNSNKIWTFNTKDGLMDDDMRWVMQHSSGDFWCGTNSGLSIFKAAYSGVVEPVKFYVGKNNTFAYPNPFKDKVDINFQLEKSSDVRITIFNAKGIEIYSEDLGIMLRGNHQYSYTANNLAKGAYFYMIHAGTDKITGKIVYGE